MTDEVFDELPGGLQHPEKLGDRATADSAQSTSTVADYYKDRVIFITGGTGFMGKVIVEKLLRCCPDVKRVYLLLRPKNQRDVASRLKELLSSKVWDLVRRENPSLLAKLVAVEGDITSPGLGFSQRDTDLLIREVSVIFHVAATVRFNEPLRVAVLYNLEGTQKVADLAKRMENLEAFVHMSTAFSNCDRQEIGETVYPSPYRPEDIQSLLQWIDDSTLESIVPKLTRGHPNTYTFTKLLAENYLAEKCRDLPITIVRPAIVTASWKEPFPGWVDNTYGPTGLFAAIRRGILRTTLMKRKVSVEVTPVDMAANLVLVAARYHNRSNGETASWPVVLNYSSGPVNSLTMDVLYCNVLPRLMRPGDEGPQKQLRAPQYHPSSCPASYSLRCIFNHYLPAALEDLKAILLAKKPRMLSACGRLQKVLADYMYFTLNEWSFRCDKAMELLQGLSAEDEKIFGFNLKNVEWPSYMESYADGVCRFVLGETVDTGQQDEPPHKSPDLWTKYRCLFPSLKLAGITVAITFLLIKYISFFKFIFKLLGKQQQI